MPQCFHNGVAVMRKVYYEGYLYAGVATSEGQVIFRASTRAGYQEKLQAQGDVDVKLIQLPRPMAKPVAALHVMAHPNFQSPDEQAVLRKAARAAISIDQGEEGQMAPIDSSPPDMISRVADL